MKSKSRGPTVLCCGLILCAVYAFASEPSEQQSAATSTTPANNHSRDDDGTSLPSKRKKHVIVHEVVRKEKEYVSGKVPVPKSASIAKTKPSKLIHNKSCDFKPQSLGTDPQLTSIEHIAPGKATNRSLLAQPMPGSVIGGGNFRNRQLTPIPGAIGGPARTTRNTARLSGTDMGHKHLNR